MKRILLLVFFLEVLPPVAPAASGLGVGHDAPFISMTLAGRPVRLPVPLRRLPSHTAAGTDTSACVVPVPDSDLAIRLHGWHAPKQGAVYYVPFLLNRGTNASELVENIRSADLRVLAEGEVGLHYANGSTCSPDDFLPRSDLLPPGASRVFEPLGGRSSSGVMPFFNLAWRGGGLVAAVGWSGQWQAAFRRSEGDRTAVTAGLPYAALSLQPGEAVRLPSVLLLSWKGDDWLIGQNALRRLLLDRFCPRQEGELVMPPVAHNTAASLHLREGGWNGGNERTQMEAIAAIAPLGIEAYWLDAYWFPGAFPNGVGNWFCRPNDFPRGLKPLADAAHARGMKFILWFEPERVGPDTRLDREHPGWLLGRPGTSRLLNLGVPEARRHLTDLISLVLAESGVDVYRQDFNLDPLPLWQAADTPERRGITEIRHVEGLYGLWDELRRRHAGLWIDNCASGGRRIDLETLARSLPLWRSDTPDPMIWDKHLRDQAGAGDQVQTAGLSLWVPLHSGGVWGVDPYRFRSAMQAGVVLYEDPRRPAFPAAQATAAFSELKTLRPFFLGDFYPLTPVNTNEAGWHACQYHRPDLDAGFAVLFRRRLCAQDKTTLHLRGVKPGKKYSVSWHWDYPPGRRQTLTGQSLRALPATVPSAPGCVLIRYARENRKPLRSAQSESSDGRGYLTGFPHPFGGECRVASAQVGDQPAQPRK